MSNNLTRGLPTTKLRVGPLDYEVRWVDANWRASANCVACCDNETQIITLYEGLTPSQLPCSFVHEVGHALLYAARFTQEPDITEEVACNLAGYMITGFWRDNPEVFKWWSSLL
jgi:hypothetical protein